MATAAMMTIEMKAAELSCSRDADMEWYRSKKKGQGDATTMAIDENNDGPNCAGEIRITRIDADVAVRTVM